MKPDQTFLRAFAETRAFLLGRPGRFQIGRDGRHVLYLRTPPRTPVLGLFELEIATGVERELVTPAQVLNGADEAVSDAERARRERQRITDRGFTSFELSPDGSSVLLPLAGKLFLFDRATNAVRVLVDGEGDPLLDARFSPDGARVAFVRSCDLWIVDTGGGSPRPVTSGGTEDTPNGLAEFVAQEEMARHEGYWWSPRGDALAFAAVDQREVETFAIADPSRPERAPATFRYPRPGKVNARVRVGVVSVTGNAPPVWMKWDDARLPYLARVTWASDRAPLALYVQSRDQREAALLVADVATGETRTVTVDRHEAWINLERGVPRWLPDGSGLLHVIEHEDSRELVVVSQDGARRTTLSSVGFLHLVAVASDSAGVVVAEGDAITNRLVRVTVADPSQRTVLIDDGGEHDVVAGGDLIVDTRVAADTLPSTCVRRGRDGSVMLGIPHVAEAPPFRAAVDLPQVTGVSGRRYHTAILRPRDATPGAKLPVVVHVYGGPHALIVKADERAFLFDQWLANHGVIVVAIDNRGTPRRGPVWERAVKGAFGQVPLDDQADALVALAARYPEMDLARVGIYGWSFGGTMAAQAVLRRPDLYHVAVAGAPVVDWRDYDTHYTERYLDLPAAAPGAYDDGSLLPHAASLSRPLLLVHGTADDNVYFFHSMKLADALLRAGRPFDFLPLPGVTHQIGDPAVREQVWRRTADYLLRHLGVSA